MAPRLPQWHSAAAPESRFAVDCHRLPGKLLNCYQNDLFTTVVILTTHVVSFLVFGIQFIEIEQAT